MQITQTFTPTSRSDWRGWLSHHHADKTEIWLVFYKKHTGKQVMSYSDAVDEALCFGWIDGLEKGLDSERFALRFTPRTGKSAWSETNVKRYSDLLARGLVVDAGKTAFSKKDHVYTSFSNKKGARQWHETHKMPRNPTLEERVAWHREHKLHCACRPVPKSIAPFVV